MGRKYLIPDSESRPSHTKLLQELRGRQCLDTDGHVGIGNVLMNFRMIMAATPRFGLFVDGNPAQVQLFDKCISQLAEPRSKSKDHFLSKLEKTYVRGFRYAPDEDYLRYFRNEIADAFADDAGYQHLRSLARSGDLAALPLDLFDAKRVSSVAAHLASAGRTVGTFYLTNLTWFLCREEDFYRREQTDKGIEHFWDNIKTLCNGDKTLICDAQHEQREIVYEHYNTGFHREDVNHYVASGTWQERSARHMARRTEFTVKGCSAYAEP